MNMIVTKNEPQKVDTVPPSPLAETIRSQFSPRKDMAIMSESVSAMIDQNKPNFQVQSKLEKHIFRGNKSTKRP
jgi:hypothetical protein